MSSLSRSFATLSSSEFHRKPTVSFSLRERIESMPAERLDNLLPLPDQEAGDKEPASRDGGQIIGQKQ